MLLAAKRGCARRRRAIALTLTMQRLNAPVKIAPASLASRFMRIWRQITKGRAWRAESSKRMVRDPMHAEGEERGGGKLGHGSGGGGFVGSRGQKGARGVRCVVSIRHLVRTGEQAIPAKLAKPGFWLKARPGGQPEQRGKVQKEAARSKTEGMHASSGFCAGAS